MKKNALSLQLKTNIQEQITNVYNLSKINSLKTNIILHVKNKSEKKLFLKLKHMNLGFFEHSKCNTPF